MTDLSDNSNGGGADNASEQPVSTSVETGNAGGQATEATPTDLFSGVDPKTLPPQAKAYYDSMLKDYREKTGRISETVKAEVEKATKTYREKADTYDQISNQEEFVKKWNEYVQEANRKSPDLSPDEQRNDPKLLHLEQKLQEMSQKIAMSEMANITDAFADAVNEKGERMHPEFDELNNIMLGALPMGEGKDEFSLLRACVELSGGNNSQEKLANGYKVAKTIHDQIFEKGKKMGMGRLQTKIMNSSLPPSNSGGDVLSVTDKKPKNAHEALAMARRGQMVSRE